MLGWDRMLGHFFLTIQKLTESMADDDFLYSNLHERDMLLNFVMGTMFLVLPTFWLGTLTWVGVRAGAIANTFATATKDAGSAGGKGPGLISSKLK
jgi:hypothetical protein